MILSNTPEHIAIVMDGNRRWAEKHGKSITEGHYAGAENVKNILECCRKYSIPFLTLFAFSTENWKRPPEEVEALMELLYVFIDRYLEDLQRKNVRLVFTGRIAELRNKQKIAINKAISITRNNNGGVLNLAINYGGRAEIVDAVKSIIHDVQDTKLSIDDINEYTFSKYLYHPEIPDPDLLIRTSGEQRISNFLLWQLSYSELYFTKVLWPDFSEDDFLKALKFYSQRKRRFGGR